MKYGMMKRLFEMATRMGKTLNEVFALVPDSFRQYYSQVQTALRDDPPDELGRDDWAYIEALIGENPNQVLLECYQSDGKCCYYLYDIAFEDGKINWSNQREVEVEAVLKEVKPAMERRLNEQVEIPKDVYTDVSDMTLAFENEGSLYASVEIAQKAEAVNRNNRSYPKEVLSDAVERLKNRINLTGPVPMETMHREDRYIGDVCAIIHDVHFDEARGIVTLPKIEILETSSGKDIKALLDAGLQFQVSQRGLGIAHEEIDASGKRIHVMDWLEIQGWDMVWNGDASIEEAVLTLNEMVEPTAEPIQEPNPEPVQEPAPTTAPQPRRFSRPAQTRVPEATPPKVEPKPAPATAPTPAPNPQQQQQLLGKEVLSLVQTAVEQAINPLKSQLETETKELHRKEFNRIGEEVLDTVLAKHPRFSTAQKDVIKRGVNLSNVYPQVESLDVDSITRVLTPLIETEIERADALQVGQRTQGWNLPTAAGGNGLHINRHAGITYNEVINDAHIAGLVDGSEFENMVEGTIDLMVREDRENKWVMPPGHGGMRELARVLENFVRQNAMRLNETQVSDLGIPITQVSMLMVPVVWRQVTAFRIAQLHAMTLPVEDIPIEKWTGQQAAASDWERWDMLDPGDSVAIPESEVDYEHYRLAAGYQPQHVRITPKARAFTRNTVMNPVMRSTALAAREIVDQTDLMLWRALIMEALKLNAVKVSTWTDCTETADGSNVFVAKPGLIPYEWIVRHDSNKNVDKSGLIRNFPADGATTAGSVTERTLTPLEVREGGGDNTLLEYGDDYTVNWVTGAITLTSSGQTKEATNGIEAKYTYATNYAVWNGSVPSGSTFVDHLLDFRFKIADARTLVKERHYEPECIAFNYGLMDKLSAGKNFTNEGGNAAQAIDMMSTVLRYAGSEAIDSTAIPAEYVIVSQKMSILFGLHTAFTMTGEVITDNTGDRRYFGEQFAGQAVPAPEKAAIVGVHNIP